MKNVGKGQLARNSFKKFKIQRFKKRVGKRQRAVGKEIQDSSNSRFKDSKSELAKCKGQLASDSHARGFGRASSESPDFLPISQLLNFGTQS